MNRENINNNKKFRIVTINFRGLNDKNKISSALDFFILYNMEICLFQETHVDELSVINEICETG